MEFLEQLCAVPLFEHLGVKVSGFVAKPTYTRGDRSEQYMFVNGRPATAPVLYYAIREGYPKLERERKPVVLLFLEMDAGLVDVNVHPTKREVRFRRSSDVRDAVMRAVGAALGAEEPLEEESELQLPVSAAVGTPPQAEAPRFSRQTPLPLTVVEREGDLSNKGMLPKQGPRTTAMPEPSRVSVVESVGGAAVGAGVAASEGAPWAWCRVLGQVGGRVVMETLHAAIEYASKSIISRSSPSSPPEYETIAEKDQYTLSAVVNSIF